MARKRTGTLVWRKTIGWCARIRREVEGVSIRDWVQLGTTNKLVARQKLAKLLEDDAGPTPEGAGGVELVRDACERIHKLRERDNVASADDEIARLRRYALADIGHLEVSKLATHHVNSVLDETKRAGKSKQTVQHVKQALANVCAQLKREGAITENVVDDAELPKFNKVVQRERAVLTDAELVVYLGYRHAEGYQEGAILERQVMACVGRMFGGLRTGDIHALTWDAFDTEGDGGFVWGWAPRQKTRRPQLLEVPVMLRPILRDWWERHERPVVGLIFPARRGKRVGKAKHHVSHARAFRRDLRRAFGIDAWDAKTRQHVTARPLTARERELFEETGYTRPVDFHSWRRAFSQALADADVNAQQATALAGHASLSAHARYLANSGKLRRLPEAALPAINVEVFGHQPCPNDETGPSRGKKSKGISSRRDRYRTCDIRLVREESASSPAPAIDERAENMRDSGVPVIRAEAPDHPRPTPDHDPVTFAGDQSVKLARLIPLAVGLVEMTMGTAAETTARSLCRLLEAAIEEISAGATGPTDRVGAAG